MKISNKMIQNQEKTILMSYCYFMSLFPSHNIFSNRFFFYYHLLVISIVLVFIWIQNHGYFLHICIVVFDENFL